MIVVIVEHITNYLIEHREECSKSPQSCVVHYMIQILSMIKTFGHQRIWRKVWLQDDSALTLYL